MENTVRVGDTVADKYRITRVLGQGGMGTVFAAEHLQLNQKVALKFLTDEAFQNAEATARFVREARLAVQIQSEHVARVLDVGTLDSGAPYMVMEHLAGQDLKNVVERGALDPRDAVDHLLHACDAIAEAHSLGIIHRDLKPANLFLTQRPDGTALIKVLDFGISKAVQSSGGASVNMTSSTAVMGSPQYMSPEQIRSSRNVDHRTDIWALGAILHELLSGKPAYEADTLPGLLAVIIADPPRSLDDSNPELPLALRNVVKTCLQKQPNERYANLAELTDELLPFASTEVATAAARIRRLINQAGLGSPPREKTESLQSPKGGPDNRAGRPGGHTNGSWSSTDRRILVHKPVPQTARRIALIAAVGSIGVASWFSLTSPLQEEPPLTPAAAPQDSNAPRTPPKPELLTPISDKPSEAPPSPVADTLAVPTPSRDPVTKKSLAAPPSKPKNPTIRRKPARLLSSPMKPNAKRVRRVSKPPKRKALPRARPLAPPLPVRKTLKPTQPNSDSLDLFDDTK